MKFATFVTPAGATTWGYVEGGLVFDLGPTGADLAPDIRAAIETGTLDGSSFLSATKTSYSEANIVLLPPIPDPRKIICIGVNYRSHQEEAGKAKPAAPTVFTRFADTQMGHEAPAVMPVSTTKFDYEGEVAIVIGREAWRVEEGDAYDFVAGYSIYNDFSVRDWQLAASQWTPGKNFPGTGAFGPYLVRSVDVGDPGALMLETRVNGEVRQRAALADLIFTIPQIIEHVTHFTRLMPGDVIVTGTPGGVGLFREPSGLLKEGDSVEVEVSGIGVLRNEVALENA